MAAELMYIAATQSIDPRSSGQYSFLPSYNSAAWMQQYLKVGCQYTGSFEAKVNSSEGAMRKNSNAM